MELVSAEKDNKNDVITLQLDTRIASPICLKYFHIILSSNLLPFSLVSAKERVQAEDKCRNFIMIERKVQDIESEI